MSKISRSPLRAPRGGASARFASLFRAHASLALAFALLASLAPAGPVARAQVVTKGEYPFAGESSVYVIHQTPDGDISCRLATPDEIEPEGDEPQVPVHRINHLPGKEDATTSASAGLIIILEGTEQLEANPVAKQAFINAAAKWEALISTQITVTIKVDYGTTFFGQPYPSASTLGVTSSRLYGVSYSGIRQRLINRVPAGSDEAALLNNLPATSLPTDIGSVSSVFLPVSLLRVHGYSDTDQSGNPLVTPRIGFNSNFSFDFNPDDGVSSAQTDFDSVAVHEIGHALGFTSQVGARELDPASTLGATIWDFYRFRPSDGTSGAFSSAPRVLSTGDPHVHFSGGAQIALSTGNPKGEGGDGEQASHWKDNRNGLPYLGIMDPTIPRGRHDTITQNDLSALDFFGYTLAGVAPPPPPPAPANDNFASAQVISGSSGSATGTNVGATSEAGEPNHSPNNDAGGKSVWYNWTAPASGSVTFNTSGSNFDTVLAAYTGAGVGALSAIIKNDDVESGVVTTSAITFNATGGTTYRIAVDGWGGEAGSIALNWSHTASGGGGGQPSVVSFASHAYSASETSGAAVITLGRSNPGTTVSVGVRTIDNPAAVPCSDTTTAVAFARCDYASTIDTVTFGPDETTRTISVPLIDDTYGEPNETLQIELINVVPGQVQFGAVPTTTLTITSDEPPGQDGSSNPVVGVPFFVRQHYLDFLSREPEAGEPWSAVLNGCVNQFNTDAAAPAAGCDRLTVSAAFFGSQEFALKGGYAFRFYKVAFGRLPEYAEIVSDMRQLTGATGEEVIARRAAFPAAFVQRTDFAAVFGAMSNEQFVNTLMGRYNLLLINSRNPSDPENGAKTGLSRTGMTAALNNGQWTRAQVLRAIADSDEVTGAEFRPAFVAMQYYGYLRRTPESTGYQNWLNYLNANPNDSRTMVNGFLNSQEYRLRFGRQ